MRNMTIQERVERESVMTGLVPLRTADAPVIRIEPSKGWASLKLHELWEYRELLYFLTWRDIKVRYKQTVLGAAWAIIEWKMEDGRWRMESIFPSPLSPFHVQACPVKYTIAGPAP